MKRVLGLSSLLLVSAMGFAEDATFTEAQKKQIQSMMHDYLVSQPEVLIEASQALQKKQQERMQSEIQALVKTHANEIFTDQYTTLGDPKGSVTLVEFFDYQCIHCKKMASVVESLMKKNPQLRVVYKEFPIFGEASAMGAKAALAAAMQGKYVQMHDLLLQMQGHLTEKEILKIAQKLKLSMSKFKTDMNGALVKQALDQNRKLAENLHLMGTPAFIVASTPNGVYAENANKPITFIPGAASEQALMEMIQKAAS